MDDTHGSIEQGKVADFAVLEEDPYSVEPKTIKDIKIWGTVLGGKKQPYKGLGV
jgi:predicted amidohydrolase YtcJ